MAIYINKKIVFRCDVSKSVGYGHLTRCISIAEKLEKKYSYKIYFIINKNKFIKKKFLNKRFKFFFINEKLRYEDKIITEILSKYEIKSIFFDVKKNYPTKFFNDLKKNKIKTITIDDKYKKRINCDLCFYPPVPQVKKFNWSKFKGKKFIGWQYIPLRSQFEKLNKLSKDEASILLLGGGTDKNNFTYDIIRKINKFSNKLKITVSLGFNKKINKQFKKLVISSKHNISIVQNEFLISKLMNKSLLIILPFGISAYEAAAMKKYTFIFTRSRDDEYSSTIFQKKKVSKVFNKKKKFSEKNLIQYINNYNNYNFQKKFQFSKLIRCGTNTIAKIIHED